MGGSSAYNLTQLEITSLSKLQSVLVNEISNYKENFKNENCTFIQKWPKKYKFNIWSNILKSEGYNTSHIHPAGWLSGGVYLKIPSNIKKNEAGIEFSLHGENYPIKIKNIPVEAININLKRGLTQLDNCHDYRRDKNKNPPLNKNLP